MRVRSIVFCTLTTLGAAFAASCSGETKHEASSSSDGSNTNDGSNTSGGDGGSAGGGAAGNTSAGPAPVIDGNYDCSEGSGSLPSLGSETVADGFSRPLYVTAAPGDDTRLFVVEQWGTIQVVVNGETQSEPFLDIEDRTQTSENNGDERGLLGLAFHPDYQRNGLFYVHYSALGSGDTTVSEFSVSSDDNLADPQSERVVLTERQPAGNHNGGMIEFGPDGFLYIALGDGGGGGDQFGNGQNLGSILGALNRIDVDDTSSGEYGVPSGNMTGAGVRPEIWDYGLRNPWRFSFDPCTGDLYVGDVGQDETEEVDVKPMGSENRNFGWPIKEGTSCYQANSCDESGLSDPVVEYGHGDGVSITGGYVYRGSAIPALRGYYLYADYSSERVWAFRYEAGNAVDQQMVDVGSSGPISSFGQDNAGEVYIVRRSGPIQKIITR